MMQTFAKPLHPLLVAAILASASGMASASQATSDPAIATAISLMPQPLSERNRGGTGNTGNTFDAGSSAVIVVSDGGDVGLGTTRPPRGDGDTGSRTGGRIVLTTPGEIVLAGDTASIPLGEGVLLVSAVPEPAAPLLLLAGLGLLAAVRRKLRR